MKNKMLLLSFILLGGFFIVIIAILFMNIPFLSKNTQDTTTELSQDEAKELIINTPIDERDNISKAIWLRSGILDELSYNVLWRGKTERSYTSELLDEKREGVYVTKGCGVEVFSSEDKFESGTGWPSFTQAINQSNVILREDKSFGMRRTEVLSKCGEHLGHVFNDGPKDRGGERWCINGAALEFIPKEQ
ncbi:MAG: peptide-methionine (R)-S-oxide reductase MsrB [Candidatus Nanoarchaeia archaeon]